MDTQRLRPASEKNLQPRGKCTRLGVGDKLTLLRKVRMLMNPGPPRRMSPERGGLSRGVTPARVLYRNSGKFGQPTQHQLGSPSNNPQIIMEPRRGKLPEDRGRGIEESQTRMLKRIQRSNNQLGQAIQKGPKGIRGSPSIKVRYQAF